MEDIRQGTVWEAEKEADETQCLQSSEGIAGFWSGYKGYELWCC